MCEQGFEFWVDAASKFIPMLMRGTGRCKGIEPLGYRLGYALMWALIENVFFGDERASVIAEVGEAFGEPLAERLVATKPPEHAVLRRRVARTPYVGLNRFSRWALAMSRVHLSGLGPRPEYETGRTYVNEVDASMQLWLR